jgi:phenylpyruvate tautomerase PptA (4-oxalocrotonate tautomerase family)
MVILMPIMDVSYPDGALSEPDKKKLADWFSRRVISWAGWDGSKSSDSADAIAWATFSPYSQSDCYVGGRKTTRKLFRVAITTPKGAAGADLKLKVIGEVDAMFDSLVEGGLAAGDHRVWTTFVDLEEGDWGSQGKAVTLRGLIEQIAASARSTAPA